MTNTLTLTTSDPLSAPLQFRYKGLLACFIFVTHQHWQLDPQDACSLFSGEVSLELTGDQVTLEVVSSSFLEELEAFYSIAKIINEHPDPMLFGPLWLTKPQARLNWLAPLDVMLTGIRGITDLALHMQQEALMATLDPDFLDPSELH